MVQPTSVWRRGGNFVTIMAAGRLIEYFVPREFTMTQAAEAAGIILGRPVRAATLRTRVEGRPDVFRLESKKSPPGRGRRPWLYQVRAAERG